MSGDDLSGFGTFWFTTFVEYSRQDINVFYKTVKF